MGSASVPKGQPVRTARTVHQDIGRTLALDALVSNCESRTKIEVKEKRISKFLNTRQLLPKQTVNDLLPRFLQSYDRRLHR